MQSFATVLASRLSNASTDTEHFLHARLICGMVDTVVVSRCASSCSGCANGVPITRITLEQDLSARSIKHQSMNYYYGAPTGDSI
jgi:hypothetical protein